MELDKQKQFFEILQIIRTAHSNAVRSVNTELINAYWNVGAYISREIANANWGDKTVDELAAYIKNEYPDEKGYHRRGLYRMKLFFETYSSMQFVTTLLSQMQSTDSQTDEIETTLLSQFKTGDIRNSILVKVSWSHHLVLITLKSDEEREFYLQLSIKERYSVRELERQINSSIFERVMLGNAVTPDQIKATHPNIINSLKDRYVFEFLGLPDRHSENELQTGLIGQMKNFILELGKNFLFVGEEYRVQVGNSDFYIDLLFYHRGLQCLVAFELKSEKFKPEHLGQLNFYLEALDRDVKKPNENPSIGILLCKYKDDEVVEYALSRYLSPTMVSQYQTQLPDKKLLQQKLQELFEQ